MHFLFYYGGLPANVFDLPANVFDLPVNVFDLPVNVFDLPVNVFDLPVNVSVFRRFQFLPGPAQTKSGTVANLIK